MPTKNEHSASEEKLLELQSLDETEAVVDLQGGLDCLAWPQMKLVGNGEKSTREPRRGDVEKKAAMMRRLLGAGRGWHLVWPCSRGYLPPAFSMLEDKSRLRVLHVGASQHPYMLCGKQLVDSSGGGLIYSFIDACEAARRAGRLVLACGQDFITEQSLLHMAGQGFIDQALARCIDRMLGAVEAYTYELETTGDVKRANVRPVSFSSLDELQVQLDLMDQ